MSGLLIVAAGILGGAFLAWLGREARAIRRDTARIIHAMAAERERDAHRTLERRPSRWS